MSLKAWTSHYFGSLRTRIALMLSIAILPLGIVAVYQTAAVVDEARSLQERDILFRTLRAVNAERALLRRAYGSASALGAAAVAAGPATDGCQDVMRRFIDINPEYAFAGFIAADGVMRCSSADEDVDFNGLPDWQSFMANPRSMVSANTDGAASGESVLVVSVPVYDPGSASLIGALSLSMPHAVTDNSLATGRDDLILALTDAAGHILTTGTGIDTADRFEALGIVPADVTFEDGAYLRTVEKPDGTTALAALVPLIGDRIFALGLWQGRMEASSVPFLGTTAPLFPVLMWIAALIVALFAVDRLVVSHLRRLEARMMTFTPEDPSDSFAILDNPPREIGQIATTYNAMIDQILADRATLAESVTEKELLLREVHHRVKNNLQLIASILNMQMRTVADGDARRVLRRVQDRVLSLSSIHKALYSGTALATIEADRLLDEVLRATIAANLPRHSGVATDLSFEQVRMDPDQAVPLTLLANELVTNAVKFVGRSGDGPPRIALRFLAVGTDLELRVENTTGDKVQPNFALHGTGLGSRLILAFVSQLDGEMTTRTENGIHVVTVRFPLRAPDPAGDMNFDDHDDAVAGALARAVGG